ncbi:uncharacterized protein TNCV_3507111 [Trichonephila clavipes]|uniref:Uncharacterized protein n=1 Tax=Trichonephila clavipes TaxID=2585209 RepID=A0A8X6RY42_TRICX|nr:uncharacterized protein TNCV_3507111 [Trichonephila clavipes]
MRRRSDRDVYPIAPIQSRQVMGRYNYDECTLPMYVHHDAEKHGCDRLDAEPPEKSGFGPQAGSYNGCVLGVGKALRPLVSWVTPCNAGVSATLCGKSISKNSSYISVSQTARRGCGSPVVKVSDHVRHVMSLSPVPLKIRRVEERCTLNLSSSRWCGVVARRGLPAQMSSSSLDHGSKL